MNCVIRSIEISFLVFLIVFLSMSTARAELPGSPPAGAPVARAAASATKPPAPATTPGAPMTGPAAPAAGAPAGTVPGMPAGPDIRRFEANSEIVVGESVRFSWEIAPGIAGNPIVSASILRGETVVVSSVPATGTRDVPLYSFPVGASSVTYTLKARDTAGAITTRSVAVRLIMPHMALNQLDIGIQTEPSEFRDGRPVNFRASIGSRIWPMSRLTIQVKHGDRVVKALSNFMIRGPMNIAALRGSEFDGRSGDYTVDVEYQSLHLQKRFRTVLTPYFVLAPVPR